MRLYNLLIKKNSKNQICDVKAIDEGFSFFAAFFGEFWFFFNKMFKIGLFFLIIDIFVNIFDEPNYQNSFYIIQIITIIICGFFGKEFYLEFLQKKGYKIVQFILANNQEEALKFGFEELAKKYKEEEFFEKI